ncbi:hypothetical protein JL721_11563 [Aureococcus anophagefferens]|nr:hypothetical protein JL721_11563 [Aureococcus anophagefferens]
MKAEYVEKQKEYEIKKARAKALKLRMTCTICGRESVSKEVFRYCRLSAEKGYVPAMLMVGMAHREGQGVERDLDEAKRWLERAAAKGNAQAVAALDEMNA